MTKIQTKPFCLKESDSFNFYIGINAGGKLLGRLRDAKKSIKIISPFITEDEIELLREKRIGIGLEDISIITSAADDNFRSPSQVKALKKLLHREKKDGGAEYEYHAIFKSIFFSEEIFHAKLYILDENIAFAGSMNFTGKGMEKNHETCITIKDPQTIKELCEYYDGLFDADLPKWDDINALGKKVYFAAQDFEKRKTYRSAKENNTAEKSRRR
jgi:phosphatidylserine/phosphatidylglycerophosphate/cardiolipin synthase-like enzyme